jgi:hypothetical protein
MHTLTISKEHCLVTIIAPDEDRLLQMLELQKKPMSEWLNRIPTGCNYGWGRRGGHPLLGDFTVDWKQEQQGCVDLPSLGRIP